MLSVPHPAVPRLEAFRRRRSLSQSCAAAVLLVAGLALLTPLRSASAQGTFTTNKPFLVSVDKVRAFTLTGIPVIYTPLHGPVTSGFLALSGTPDSRTLTLFSSVRLSFSPTLGGPPTVTDTFPHGLVTAVGANLYHLASLGTSAQGNSFNLHGGFLKSASLKSAFSGNARTAPKAVRSAP